MKKGLGDAQYFLIREIFICFVGLLVSIFKDPLYNLLHAMGLTAAAIPVSFGMYQIGGIIFFGTFLFVSASEFWMYYRPSLNQFIDLGESRLVKTE